MSYKYKPVMRGGTWRNTANNASYSRVSLNSDPPDEPEELETGEPMHGDDDCFDYYDIDYPGRRY